MTTHEHDLTEGTEPIVRTADPADVVEQSRPLVEEPDPEGVAAGEPGTADEADEGGLAWEADAGDTAEQRIEVALDDDDREHD